MFQYAIQLKIISVNPIESLNIHRDKFIPKIIKKETDLFFLENEEHLVKMFAYQDYKITKNSLPLAIPLLFLTGIRDGELCGLHWRDIEGDYLHVQSEIVEQIDKDGNFNGYRWVDHCKSQAGDRLIPLSKEAKELLQTIKKNNFLNGLPISQDNFIFLRKKKNDILFCTSRCFESRIKKYCKQANMEVLKSQHDVRRTFATNLYYLGMPIKNISKLMGHETIEQTEAYIKCRTIENNFDYMELLSKKSKSEQILII